MDWNRNNHKKLYPLYHGRKNKQQKEEGKETRFICNGKDPQTVLIIYHVTHSWYSTARLLFKYCKRANRLQHLSTHTTSILHRPEPKEPKTIMRCPSMTSKINSPPQNLDFELHSTAIWMSCNFSKAGHEQCYQSTTITIYCHNKTDGWSRAAGLTWLDTTLTQL